MHDNQRVLAADIRDGFDNEAGEMEPLALPVSRKVLTAAFDRAVVVDQAGTPDPDKRCEPHLVVSRPAGQIGQHFDEAPDSLLAGGLLLAMPPQLKMRNARIPQVAAFLQIELDNAYPDVRAADIHGSTPSC